MNPLRRFIFRLLLFLAIPASLLGVVFGLYQKRFPIEQSLYAASLDKHRLLQTQAAPRMIFVGGSSMAFGLDSGRVAGRCGYHPVNMGLIMATGLELMLQEVSPWVRPGDVVVLSPEYQLLERYYHGEPEYLARLLECHPSLLRALSWSQLKELLDRGYLHHTGRVLRTVGGQFEGILDGITNAYNHRGAFNANGDVIAHHGVQGHREQRGRVEFNASPIALAAVEHLNRFHAECQAKGVRVFFSHPPYEKAWFDVQFAAISKADRFLRERLTIPFLDSAEEMTFPSEQMFDTEYHLNLDGIRRRSNLMAERLTQALAAPPPTPRLSSSIQTGDKP